MNRFFIALIAMLAMVSSVFALSPPGTPEANAEMLAIQKMAQNWPAYRVQTGTVQMRSNFLSISISTTNRIGNTVRFRALTTLRTRRDGTRYYEVSVPEMLQ